MASDGTGARQRIFEAAEALVADAGFEALSTREITTRAGVNLAAVNYHFGSQTKLVLEIFATRAAELNRERSALLAAADPSDVRAILRALAEPATLWTDPSRRTALRFLIRARYEGPREVRDAIRTDVRHLRRFVDALAAALPELPREEIAWRLHFALGVLHHNQAADYERLALLSDGTADPQDREALLGRLIDFLAGGFGLPGVTPLPPSATPRL